MVRLSQLLTLVAFLLATAGSTAAQTASRPACAPDDGGLTLPEGFCAAVVAELDAPARHLAVRDNGDLYVFLRESDGGGIVALRDTTGDGRMDVEQRFGDLAGTGIDVVGDFLYVAPDTAVLRYRLPAGGLVPTSAPELIAGGLTERGSHAAKTIAFDDAGHLYVNVGAPSNACQEQDRTLGSPGMDPCPILDDSGGIWRFRADAPGQTQARDGYRYATGIRNAVALDWNDAVGGLYLVQHGRDQLHHLFSDLYTEEESATLPSEEFVQVDDGDDFGWPYCYNDHVQGVKVLAPEYGGDGQTVGRCAEAESPIVAFPGHYAPNDLVFYHAGQFPERYRGGAFVAFHGSWNRAPLPQRGYQVAFVPFDGAAPSGDWETFADGFAGVEPIESPGDAQHRPMGLAVAPDGSLYIADSVEGRIWRVLYEGM